MPDGRLRGSTSYSTNPSTIANRRRLSSMAPSQREPLRKRTAEYQAIWQLLNRVSRKKDYRNASVAVQRTMLETSLRNLMEKRTREGKTMCHLDGQNMIENHLRKEAGIRSDVSHANTSSSDTPLPQNNLRGIANERSPHEASPPDPDELPSPPDTPTTDLPDQDLNLSALKMEIEREDLHPFQPDEEEDDQHGGGESLSHPLGAAAETKQNHEEHHQSSPCNFLDEHIKECATPSVIRALIKSHNSLRRQVSQLLQRRPCDSCNCHYNGNDFGDHFNQHGNGVHGSSSTSSQASSVTEDFPHAPYLHPLWQHHHQAFPQMFQFDPQATSYQTTMCQSQMQHDVGAGGGTHQDVDVGVSSGDKQQQDRQEQEQQQQQQQQIWHEEMGAQAHVLGEWVAFAPPSGSW